MDALGETGGPRDHVRVGVGEPTPFGEDADHLKCLADSPDGLASDERREACGGSAGEAEDFSCLSGLGWWEAEEDRGLRVGDESGADLGGGGAVVGLSGEVFESVSYGDVGNAVGAGKFLAGLVVAGDVWVAEQRPDLFEYLVSPRHGVALGGGEELLQPSGGGDHHERLFFGVRHAGEVDDYASAFPVDVDAWIRRRTSL